MSVPPHDVTVEAPAAKAAPAGSLDGPGMPAGHDPELGGKTDGAPAPEVTGTPDGKGEAQAATNIEQLPSPRLRKDPIPPRQKGNRPLRDSDPVERNPWESFFLYAIFGLVFAVGLPFLMQVLYEFHKQKLEMARDFIHSETDKDDGRTRSGPFAGDLGVVMPFAFLVSASSFFPPWGLVCSVVVAGTSCAIRLFCYSSKVVDQYLKEIFEAAGCCTRKREQGPATPAPKEQTCMERRCQGCCRVCRLIVFLVAFSLLPLAAWGGRSLWKAVAAHEYYICQLVCSQEADEWNNKTLHYHHHHNKTLLHQRCEDNNMVKDPPKSVWKTDGMMAVITSAQLVFRPKNASKYKSMCEDLFAIDHSDWGEQMLEKQHNFTAFEGLLLQSRQIGVLEIYGPPCGVAWLIMMVASRLALRRKLTSLNAARKLFLKQNLESKSTEYVWLFTHMYFMQGLSIPDIRRTWVVQKLKDADPALHGDGPVDEDWLTVTPVPPPQAAPTEGPAREGAEEEEVPGKKAERKEHVRRRPKVGDRVEVEYQAYWELKEGRYSEPVKPKQRVTFTVDNDDKVIKAFHIGVQKMRFPLGLQGQKGRKCDSATFTIHLDKPKADRAAAGFDPEQRPDGCTALVYEVTLIHGRSKEEDADSDADGFVDTTSKSCSPSKEFFYATLWSVGFAVGFTLIPGLVRAFNAYGSKVKLPMFGILSTQEVKMTLFFNTFVIFVTNGLVFFGFVRAYFALDTKLQTMLAFDCMWQFPEEHLLNTVEDCDGAPLLVDAEKWVQVLDAIDTVEEDKGQPAPVLSEAAQAAKEAAEKKRKEDKKEFFDHSGYRARFTPQSLEDSKLLKTHLERLDEWFNMRRYLQIDAYDERISLELAMVVTLITLLPEVMVVFWNFKVLGKEKSRVQAVNVLALWNFLFSLFFLFRYLMVTLKFNDAYDRHAEQLESLRSHVELALVRKANRNEDKEMEKQRTLMVVSRCESTVGGAGEECLQVPEEVALMSQYLVSIRKSGSWALFFGIKVNRRLVSGYLSFAALSVLTQVFPILRGLTGEGDN